MKKNYFFMILCVLIITITLFIILDEKDYNFSLKSEFKEKTTLQDFKGKKLIIYFGYTFCPDVCPTTLNMLSQILTQLNNEKFHILFVSLDPQRDGNIKETNEWLRYFYPKSDALIAENEKELEKITKKYGVIYQKIDLKDSFMKYSIAHSNEIYLVDEKGKFYKAINDLNPEEVFIELSNFAKH